MKTYREYSGSFDYKSLLTEGLILNTQMNFSLDFKKIGKRGKPIGNPANRMVKIEMSGCLSWDSINKTFIIENEDVLCNFDSSKGMEIKGEIWSCMNPEKFEDKIKSAPSRFRESVKSVSNRCLTRINQDHEEGLLIQETQEIKSHKKFEETVDLVKTHFGENWECDSSYKTFFVGDIIKGEKAKIQTGSKNIGRCYNRYYKTSWDKENGFKNYYSDIDSGD